MRRGLSNFCIRKEILMHQDQKWLHFGYSLEKNSLLEKEGQNVTNRFYWCLGPELNRHGGGPPRDFKSLASTNSATQAFRSFSLIRDVRHAAIIIISFR
jgi:hypothetical protein